MATPLNARIRISFGIGAGNNPNMVEKTMLARTTVERVSLASLGANIQWTPYLSKQATPTLLQQPHKIVYSTVDSLVYLRGVDNQNPADLADRLMQHGRLFHLGTYCTRETLQATFTAILNPGGVPKRLVGFACENVRIANHIPGIKCISRKGVLLQTMTDYFARETTRPCRVKRARFGDQFIGSQIVQKIFLREGRATSVLPPTVIVKSSEYRMRELRAQLELILDQEAPQEQPQETKRSEVGLASAEMLPSSEGPAGIAFGNTDSEVVVIPEEIGFLPNHQSQTEKLEPEVAKPVRAVTQNNSMWIIKPGENANRGAGIKVAHSLNEALEFAQEMIEAPKETKFEKAQAAQKAVQDGSKKGAAPQGAGNPTLNAARKKTLLSLAKEIDKEKTVVVQKYLEKPLKPNIESMHSLLQSSLV